MKGIEFLKDSLSKQKNLDIPAHIIDRIVEILKASNDVELKYKILVIITNIATLADEVVVSLAYSGFLQYAPTLLRCDNALLVSQTAWAIGNIAMGNGALREYCIACGVLPPLVEILRARLSNEKIVPNVMFAMSMLCYTYSLPSDEEEAEMLKEKEVNAAAESESNESEMKGGAEASTGIISASGVPSSSSSTADKSSSTTLNASSSIIISEEEANIYIKPTIPVELLKSTYRVITSCIPLFLQYISHRQEVVRDEACLCLSILTTHNPGNTLV
eukprot:MONOS_6339.1-p1 / transcript=MONOS_6339.1 / gene=MONOS_6339 / organism=Monocercomonoides_exilis_PA203 / gene_product=unspecified product / transcript_product=unspecified product / location=Mono_scaffold00198:47280-48216(-) / protein_length=275 / sequence_SO=supercontig / SO=protein_coding / is_pseudo=false